jgi:hypothetical protein
MGCGGMGVAIDDDDVILRIMCLMMMTMVMMVLRMVMSMMAMLFSMMRMIMMRRYVNGDVW